ncbi:hypothetical protein NKH54_23410 [Mesorhizobium sp. M1004]|uniref:hypothetical protein n=1 Tax=Mesorhizobium sp. M1004 TaxID=2957046 RepID=UPI00333A2B44
MADHLADAITGDPVAISDLADEVMKAADSEGIGVDEITEEVGSVFEVTSTRCSIAMPAWRTDRPRIAGVDWRYPAIAIQCQRLGQLRGLGTA